MFKLIVALGNPGPEHELNRHNIGWLVVDSLDNLRSNNWKDKFKGVFTTLDINGEKIYFLKPQTYMNLSGESVQPLCQFFKISRDEILVLHDELDVDFGQVQFRTGGGLAGHNGLKSIAQKMGGNDFHRMRIGIGRPSHGNVSGWVLGNFPAEQDEELGIILKNTATALEFCIKNGIQKSSQKFNKKDMLTI